ncbi:heavy metal translocatin, partial [Schizopora paradoxa]
MTSITTTILVSNLHCSSCVNTVRETLALLSPPPRSIHTSLINQSISVEHSPELSVRAIKDALDGAGFDLVVTPDAEEYHLERSKLTFPSDWLSRKRQKHAEQSATDDQRRTPDRVANIVGTTKAGRPPRKTPNAQQRADQGPFIATFSVGGMTCASCVSHVTEATSELEGVSDVAVNLVGKSATAILKTRELVPVFIEAVVEGGYEAELISVEPVAEASEESEEEEVGPRSVALRVDGMFCAHCPGRAMKALERFGEKIVVDEPLGAWDSPNPIFKITYQPSPSTFTIRDIVTAISSAKDPPFIVSIARPPSLEERAKAMHAREQRALLHRLLSAVILAIPTFIIGIVFMTLVPVSNHTRQFFMAPLWAGNVSRAEWALFILATPAMFYSAGQFHRRSLKELHGLWRRGSRTPLLRRFVRFGSMNLLVSLGVSIAYFSSIALLVLAALEKRDPSGMGDDTTYFDSVVFLTMFLLCGRFLEAYSKGRTADAITALGALRPSEALVLVPEAGNSELDSDTLVSDRRSGLRVQKVAVDLLEVGDIVRVPLGSSPPADGVIVSSSGSKFDESSLTGESRPITKNVGDRVFVGTINRGTVVDVKIIALGGETMLDQIVKVVREGQTKRAPIERLADVLTGYFVPVITLLAILTWVIWLSLGFGGALPQRYLDIPVGGWAVWAMEFAIAVFVVACPCGIGLAAPTALLVGSGLAAKFGILVRGGGEAFQEAAQLDIVVFDKTGTLTQGGEPRITNAELSAEGAWDRNVLLSVAHALESTSSHPLALAIRRYCEDEGRLTSVKSEDDTVIEEIGGKGLKGKFSSPHLEAIIGNEAWMSDHHAVLSVEQEVFLSQWKSEGKSVILLAVSSGQSETFTIVGIFAASDVLRPEAKGVVSALQAQGLGTWMISGDNEVTARAVARSVNIPETNVIAGVLPHQKAERVAWLQQVGQKRQAYGRANTWVRRLLEGLRVTVDPLNKRAIVAMVGDGINDAPALARADVGIAIGSGSDVAISSASFILVHSDLKSILTLTDLSRKVFRRVKFNFFWALVYNLVALPVAAGVIYPAHNSRLSPVWASLAMALSSVTVVLSSLMLRLYKEHEILKRCSCGLSRYGFAYAVRLQTSSVRKNMVEMILAQTCATPLLSEEDEETSVNLSE